MQASNFKMKLGLKLGMKSQIGMANYVKNAEIFSSRAINKKPLPLVILYRRSASNVSSSKIDRPH